MTKRSFAVWRRMTSWARRHRKDHRFLDQLDSTSTSRALVRTPSCWNKNHRCYLGVGSSHLDADCGINGMENKPGRATAS
jgi:hypothetical protein